MMDMGRISEIRQRISEIEHQFGAVKKINGTDFSHRLQKEMKKIEECIECGACQKKCPYSLNTPALLKKNYEDYKKVLAGEVTV